MLGNYQYTVVVSRNPLEEKLLGLGVPEVAIQAFLNSVHIQENSRPTYRDSTPLMEYLTVSRLSGTNSYSVKPYNMTLNLQKLLALLLGIGASGLLGGATLSLCVIAIGGILNSNINLSKNDAAIVLALHNAGAFSRNNFYITKESLIEKTYKYTDAWSIPRIDIIKAEESIINLRAIKAIEIISDRIGLNESIRVTNR